MLVESLCISSIQYCQHKFFVWGEYFFFMYTYTHTLYSKYRCSINRSFAKCHSTHIIIYFERLFERLKTIMSLISVCFSLSLCVLCVYIILLRKCFLRALKPSRRVGVRLSMDPSKADLV